MKYRHILENIIKILIAFCLFSVFLLVLWQVISRYILGDPSRFTDEAVRYLMIWMMGFAASLAFGIHEKHISLTIFKDKLNPFTYLMLDLLFTILICAFCAIFLIKGGYNLAIFSWYESTNSLGFSKGYVFLILPIMGVLICIFKILDWFDLRHIYKTNPTHIYDAR
ncbi:MAG: TRAP transporter small permease [Desulfopila sp.]